MKLKDDLTAPKGAHLLSNVLITQGVLKRQIELGPMNLQGKVTSWVTSDLVSKGQIEGACWKAAVDCCQVLGTCCQADWSLPRPQVPSTVTDRWRCSSST